MLTQRDVNDHTSDFLITEGYSVEPSVKGTDITAIRDTELMKVLSKGLVNDKLSTSQVGKEYNKNQVKENVSILIYNMFKLISSDNNPNCKYAIAVPDSKHYMKIIGDIKPVVDKIGIEIFYVSEMGIVSKG